LLGGGGESGGGGPEVSTIVVVRVVLLVTSGGMVITGMMVCMLGMKVSFTRAVISLWVRRAVSQGRTLICLHPEDGGALAVNVGKKKKESYTSSPTRAYCQHA
jgi:hypothetical protein